MPNPHKVVESTFSCGTRLHLGNPEQLPILARCGIRNKINVPTKLVLQVFIRGIHLNFVCRIYLDFGTCLQICLWNPGTYRQKIVRLFSAVWPLNEKKIDYNYINIFFLIKLKKDLFFVHFCFICITLLAGSCMKKALLRVIWFRLSICSSFLHSLLMFCNSILFLVGQRWSFSKSLRLS